MSYLEGSEIRGHVLRDTAAFGTSSAVSSASASVHFGCQTYETGKFRRQAADGILGLQADEHAHSRHSSRIPSVLHSLVTQLHAHNAFSLCLGETTGLLLLGGTPDPARMASSGAAIAAMAADSPERFTLTLIAIQVETTPTSVMAHRARRGARHFASLSAPPAHLNPTLVDSGTTFLFVSSPIWRSLHGTLRARAPELRLISRKHVCAHMSDARRDALPIFRLVLAGATNASTATLDVTPRHYMVRYPSPRRGRRARSHKRERFYCAEIFDSGRSGGTVLGASVLRHREVIFNLERRGSIGFVDAACEAATPATSSLRGAFVFAPCNTSSGRG